MLLNLTERGVDIFDHDFLDVESLNDLSDHSDLVAGYEFHSKPRARSAFIVLSMQGERLIKMHRADRDPADQALVGIRSPDHILHDEWNTAKPESPSGFLGKGVRGLGGFRSLRISRGTRRVVLSAGQRDFAKDPLVPDESFGGIRQGAPNPVDWRTDRR